MSNLEKAVEQYRNDFGHFPAEDGYSIAQVGNQVVLYKTQDVYDDFLRYQSDFSTWEKYTTLIIVLGILLVLGGIAYEIYCLGHITQEYVYCTAMAAILLSFANLGIIDTLERKYRKFIKDNQDKLLCLY